MNISKFSSPSPRLWCGLVLTLIAFALMASVPASATPPAAFTTVNVGIDGSGHCHNGTGLINCNIYDGKQYVWLNGGPGGTSGLAPGMYFFAVLDPGSQKDPNDGSSGNLSSPNDAYTNRTFSVLGGGVAYSGTHDFDSNLIRLMPYDDTSNPGGVYILAICSLSSGYPVDPKSCKYDAFKVKKTNPPGQPSTATVTVCKFWDQNFDHLWNNDEPFIGEWPITAVLSGNTNVSLTQSTVPTSNAVDLNTGVPGPDFGCATFTLNWSNDTHPVTVTFTEGNAPVDSSSQSCNLGAQTCGTTPTATWTQSAPWDFNGNPPALMADTIQVSPNDDAQADVFGNFYGQDLSASKTATPSFTRTYNWTLTKSLVSPTGNPVEQSGNSVTITYHVTATETGFSDSSWSVTGTISVTNPNGFDVTGVNVSDSIYDSTNALDANASCSVTGGSNATITANTTSNFAYSCSYSGNPSTTSETNKATVTWPGTFGTPDTTATGTATFSFTTPTSTVNKTVTVTDCFNGCSGGASTLGTLTASDTTPYTTHTYTVTQNVTITGGSCASFSNTATITGTTLNYTTPEVDVTICNEKTGALTMGFWQNKNGQGIITSGGSISGVCKSGTWLRQLNPFMDLSSSATCVQVAGYVYNVIKAATCTSTTKTCNSMLKAQMLATALDVYFSDPGLGGNQIGAPNPIGGVGIDLSHICGMIDGSGGGSCSGIFEDARYEFGISTNCKGATVNTMLTYSNYLSLFNGSPVSNSGGSAWYLQNKTKQVYAKDGFDNVNNQVAGITSSVCTSTF